MKKRNASQQSQCSHRQACGRRCRKPVPSPGSPFCPLHQPHASAEPELDLSAALVGGLPDFSSTSGINLSLCRLYTLLTQNRISSRRAAVLAFIATQILRTIALMERQSTQSRVPETPLNIIWDLPCPPRELRPDGPVIIEPAAPRTSDPPPANARKPA